jgi:hypothetical protein
MTVSVDRRSDSMWRRISIDDDQVMLTHVRYRSVDQCTDVQVIRCWPPRQRARVALQVNASITVRSHTDHGYIVTHGHPVGPGSTL